MRKCLILIMLVFFLGGCCFINQTKKPYDSELRLLPQNILNVTIQDLPFQSEFDLSKVSLTNFTESEGVLYFTVESEMFTRTKSIYSYRWSDNSLKSVWDFKNDNYYVSSISILNGKIYLCAKSNDAILKTGNIPNILVRIFEIAEIDVNGYHVIATQKTIVNIPKLSIFDNKIIYLTSEQDGSLFSNSVRTIDSSGSQNVLWQESSVAPVSLPRENGFSNDKFYYFIDYSKRIIRLTASGKDEEYLFSEATYSLQTKGNQIIFESQGSDGDISLSSLNILSRNFTKLDVMETSSIYRFDPIMILSENRFLLTITDSEDPYQGSIVIGNKKGNQNSYFYIPKLLSIYALVNGIELEDGRILIWGSVNKYQSDINNSNSYILDIKKP